MLTETGRAGILGHNGRRAVLQNQSSSSKTSYTDNAKIGANSIFIGSIYYIVVAAANSPS